MANRIPTREELEKGTYGSDDPAYASNRIPSPREISREADQINNAYDNKAQSQQTQTGKTQAQDENYREMTLQSYNQKRQSDNYDFPSLSEAEQDNELKRVIGYGGAIIGFLLIVSVSLYFITKYRTSGEEEPPSPPIAEEEENKEEKEEKINPNIPKDSQFHKHLAISQTDQPFSLLDQFFLEVKSNQNPVEVSFYNQAGEAVPLKEFINVSQIDIPPKVHNILAQDYNLLLVEDETLEDSNQGIGSLMIFESVYANPKKTDQMMRDWEATMVEDLGEFLKVGVKNKDRAAFQNKEFNDSGQFKYGRYVNFSVGGTSYSMNYIVLGDKILFANGFEAFQKGVDFIKKREVD
jgi:hypothetical protein